MSLEPPSRLTPRQEKELAFFKEGTPESRLGLADLLQESDNELDRIMGETMVLVMKQTGERTEERQEMLASRHNQILQQYKKEIRQENDRPKIKNISSSDGLAESVRISRITAEEIIAILSHPASRFVTSLDLRTSLFDPPPHCFLEPEGAKTLADSTIMKKLISLNLYNHDMGDEGTKALANSINLRNLTSLYLGLNGIGAEGTRALAASSNLGNLTTLDLRANIVGDLGVKALAKSKHLRNLRSLDLSANGIGAEGAGFLADLGNLRNLTSLDLRSNYVGDERARTLAGSANLRSLTLLFLNGNYIGRTGKSALKKSEYLKNTKIID